MSLVGNLEDLGLGDIFQIVSLSRRSGTLQLTTPIESGEIVFLSGKVVAAYRTGAKETIGEGMLDMGVISPQVYQEMLVAQKSGALGSELLERFISDREQANEVLETLLKRLIFAMFDWGEGTFSFVLEDEPETWRGFTLDGTRVVGERGLSPQYLAIEGARLRDERCKDDSLASFLALDSPAAGAKAGGTGPDLERFAAGLRSDDPSESVDQGAPEAAEPFPFGDETAADDEPAEGEAPGSDVEKVIPFPTDRTRPEVAPDGEAEQESPAAAPAEDTPAEPSVAPAVGGHGSLPAVVPTPSAVPPHEAMPPSPQAAVPAVELGWTLLAVDDDPQVTRHIRRAFQSKFLTVLTAQNVDDALARSQEAQGSLVVATDLIIARSDGKGILGGLEILEEIRSSSQDLPVVIFSDYQNEEAEKRAHQSGVNALLMKPRRAQITVPGDPEAVSSAMRRFLDELAALMEPYVAQPSPEQEAPPRANAAVPAAPPSPQALATATQEEAEPSPLATGAAPSAGVSEPAEGGPDSGSRRLNTVSGNGSQPIVATAAGLVASPPSLPIQAGPGSAIPYDLRASLVADGEEFGGAQVGELPPPVLSAGEMAVLRSMLAELIDPANRDTVTLLVLRFASHLMERAVLFLAARRAFVGLGGFSVDEISDQFVRRVRKIHVPVETASILADVGRYRSMIRTRLEESAGNRLLIDGLGGQWPGEMSVAAPLISGDRVAAVLYGDNPSGRPFGATDSLEIFLQQAGLAMDRALLERRLEESRRSRRGGTESGS